MGLFDFAKKKNEGGLMDAIRCDEKDFLIWKWRPAGQDANSTRKENVMDGWMDGYFKGRDSKIEASGSQEKPHHSQFPPSRIKRPSHPPGMPVAAGKPPKHVCPLGALAFPGPVPHAHSRQSFQIQPTALLSRMLPLPPCVRPSYKGMGWGRRREGCQSS